jgi:hypothetical protein
MCIEKFPGQIPKKINFPSTWNSNFKWIWLLKVPVVNFLLVLKLPIVNFLFPVQRNDHQNDPPLPLTLSCPFVHSSAKETAALVGFWLEHRHLSPPSGCTTREALLLQIDFRLTSHSLIRSCTNPSPSSLTTGRHCRHRNTTVVPPPHHRCAARWASPPSLVTRQVGLTLTVLSRAPCPTLTISEPPVRARLRRLARAGGAEFTHRLGRTGGPHSAFAPQAKAGHRSVSAAASGRRSAHYSSPVFPFLNSFIRLNIPEIHPKFIEICINLRKMQTKFCGNPCD